MELLNIDRLKKAQENNKEYLQQLEEKYEHSKEYSDFRKIIEFYNVDNGCMNWNWCLEKIFDKIIFKKNILQLITQNYEIYYYRISKEYFPALLNEAQEFLKTYKDDKEEITNTIKFFSDAINDDVDYLQFKLDLFNHGDFQTTKFNYTTA